MDQDPYWIDRIRFVVSAQAQVDEQQQNIERERAAAQPRTDGLTKRGF